MRPTVKVWDPLVRIFHWSLVVGFLIGYLTQERRYELHLDAGYAVLGLVFFRIVWGLVGPRYARFSDFVHSPPVVLGYLRDMWHRRSARFLGHNPVGGVSILLLLALQLVIGGSGIALDAAENRAGPLGSTTLYHHLTLIKKIHVYSTDVCLAFIALHVAGVLHSGRAHGENLVWAMITGRKRA